MSTETTRTEAHTHCWHRTGTTYTSYPAQWDEVCCHCGATERKRETLPEIPPGHGPHHPNGRHNLTVMFGGSVPASFPLGTATITVPPIRCPECGKATAVNGACYSCHPLPDPTCPRCETTMRYDRLTHWRCPRCESPAASPQPGDAT